LLHCRLAEKLTLSKQRNFRSRDLPDHLRDGFPLLLLLPYIKYKTYKTSSNRRAFAEVENGNNSRVVTGFPAYP
jgi:hypothetical protein